MSRNQRAIAYLSIGAAALLFVCWIAGLGTPGMFNLPRPFSKDVWGESTGEDQARCSMMLDLRHRIGIVGKPREDTEQFLGPPDHAKADTTQYYICPLFPLALDVRALEILWVDGRAARLRITNS